MTDLEQYVIYDKPTDFPEWFVVRKFTIGAGSVTAAGAVWICESLDEARDIIAHEAPGLVRLARSPDDDPVIVEVWT